MRDDIISATFTNARGETITWGADGAHILTRLDGMAGLTALVTTSRAPGQDGETWLASRLPMCTLTLTGAVLGTGYTLGRERAWLMRVTNPRLGPGVLTVTGYGSTRRTTAYVDGAPTLDESAVLPGAGQEYAEYSGDPAAVMVSIVADNCIDAEPARNYPQLMIGVVENSGEAITWQTRYEVVSDVLRDIAGAHVLTWRIRYDSGDMLLDIRRAQDHSAGSDSPVIYSPEYDNVTGQSYTHSVAGSANVGLAAGSGTGAEREVCWVGDSQLRGLARRETYLALKSYTSLADDAAAQLSAKYSPALAFEGSLLEAGSFQYGVHWQLGDTITVQHLAWGVSMDVRMTEIEHVYEGDTVQLVATFGESAITLVDAIKRTIAPAQDDMRR